MEARLRFEGWRVVPVRPHEPLTFSAFAYHNWGDVPGSPPRSPIRPRAGRELRLSRIQRTIATWPFGLAGTDQIAFLYLVVLHWRRHPTTLTMTSPSLEAGVLRRTPQDARRPRRTPTSIVERPASGTGGSPRDGAAGERAAVAVSCPRRRDTRPERAERGSEAQGRAGPRDRPRAALAQKDGARRARADEPVLGGDRAKPESVHCDHPVPRLRR